MTRFAVTNKFLKVCWEKRPLNESGMPSQPFFLMKRYYMRRKLWKRFDQKFGDWMFDHIQHPKPTRPNARIWEQIERSHLLLMIRKQKGDMWNYLSAEQTDRVMAYDRFLNRMAWKIKGMAFVAHVDKETA